MTTQRRAELRSAFDELVGLDRAEQSVRLAAVAAHDPELFEQLARLLTADAVSDPGNRRLELPIPPGLAVVGAPVPNEPISGVSAAAAPHGSADAPGTAAADDPLGLSGRSVAHFRVQHVLGSGGIGVVYRAQDLLLGRTVALKLLLPQYSQHADTRQRLLQQARAASALEHPNLCTIHEVGETEQGQLFVSMGSYEGQTVRSHLDHRGPLPIGEAVELAGQVAQGLAAAHVAGIVHRAIKPGNLMLMPDGTLKILDLGLNTVREWSLRASAVRPASVVYMSPEQLSARQVDARTDLWSLGVVLYEMLTARLPFGGRHELSTIYRILYEDPPSPAALRSGVPLALEELVSRLLHKEVDQRPASAAEAAAALARVAAGVAAGATASAETPPLASAMPVPQSLPIPATPLVGREQQLQEIERLLQRSDVRLLTLTGAGGIGKTRLALQAIAELRPRFRDGVAFVNLAPLTDPLLLPATIARALGLREDGARSSPELLEEHLAEKHLLLMLNDFEQIVAAAPVVARLVAAAPALKVLVTSRTHLQVLGEHEYDVPPLATPEAAATLPPLERLAQCEAVRLFLERAQEVRDDFRLTAENAAAVAEICRRLDGVPLAIELAAARIKVLSPQAMLPRLENRLQLLTGGARDLPLRQQTLRAAIDSSYDLLDDSERVLFRRLAVFAGGCTLDAIEAVCTLADDAGPPASTGVTADAGFAALDVLDSVSSLVEKSLLRQAESAAGEPHFDLLETIQAYAVEKLAESGEADRLRHEHGRHFLRLAETATPHLFGTEQARWLARLEEAHDNFRAALRRARDRGDVELAARLAGALAPYWERRGHFAEGRSWLQEMHGAAGLSASTRARATFGAAVLAWRQGDYGAARPLLDQSLALARRMQDPTGIARALNVSAIVAAELGDARRAEALYEEAAARYRELGDDSNLGAVLNNLAINAKNARSYGRAESLCRESLDLAQRSGNLAVAGAALLDLGDITYRRGDLAGSEALLRESLRVLNEAGYAYMSIHALALLAQVAAAAGAWRRAALLFGATESCFRAMGSHVPPADRAPYERALSAARSALDPAAGERPYEQGAAMSLDEAIAHALQADPTDS